MKDFAWFRPDIGRVIVSPDAGIHVAALPMKLPLRGDVPFPTLLVSIERKHRTVTRSLVTVCKDTKVTPVIHVWERKRKWVQVGALFVITDPKPEMLSAVFPGNDAVIRAHTWKEVRLFFNVKIPSDPTEMFCSMYKNLQAASVIITGLDRREISLGAYSLDMLKPLARFRVSDVEFTRPVVVLNRDER